MAGDIPFNKKLDLKPGVVDEAAPGIRRILVNNPGPFTFTGTLSYIVGRGKVAIIDPGPNDTAHIGALLDAVRGETVTHIFVTHTHRDHSPATISPSRNATSGRKS
jgi:glyoxylase-like metal-dependent hydrolase (beta-lactamase superfamily II)